MSDVSRDNAVGGLPLGSNVRRHMDPVLVGYFAKEPLIPAEAELLGAIDDVASVAECIVPGAKDWHRHWKHNAFGRFDSEQLALSVVPPELRGSFDVYAYETYPVIFDVEGEHPLSMPSLGIDPPGAEYELLGYDVVELNNVGRNGDRELHYEFGCSPLTCNSLMKEVPVNEHCLLGSPATALELARQVAASNGRMGEPGPYVAVKVLRRRMCPPTFVT